MLRLSLYIVGLLACSACQVQPEVSNESRTGYQARDQARAVHLPAWVTLLIKRLPANSKTVIEESAYQGHRAYLILPAERTPGSSNDHVLHSDNGGIICEFGGLPGQVTAGSCDLNGIGFVRTLYPKR